LIKPILVAVVEGGCHTTGNPLFYDLSFFDLFRWMLIIISTILAIFALVSRFVNSQKDVSQDTILQEKDTAFETIGELGWLDHRSVHNALPVPVLGLCVLCESRQERLLR
jgi:hypothetical protein